MLKKNKTAATAKKLPVKKAAIKKTDSKTTAKKSEPIAKTVPPAAVVAAPAGKKYIAINDVDPELQRKYRLVLIITIIAVIFLAVSWFFSLRYNVTETIYSFRNGEMKAEIAKIASQFSGNSANTNKSINQNDLSAIREEIIKKISDSISSSTWPVHDSEILGLQISYPENWYKQEITDSLTLSSYPLNAAAPDVFGQVKIKKISEKKNTLADYLTAEQKDSYELDPSWTYLGTAPAIKYVKKNIGTDISWLIIAGINNKVFQVELYSKNGQGLYEKLFSEILSSIKF